MIGLDTTKSVKEAFWRKKGYKESSVVVIRLAETIVVSIIPSLISVLLIIVSQDPNGRAWKIFQFLSLLVFIGLNCFFWTRFAIMRKKRLEYYAVNIGIYAVYVLVSYLAFVYSDDVILCSMVFAPLRGLEGFGAKTMSSLKVVHITIICLMVVCDVSAGIYLKIKERIEKEKQAQTDDVNRMEEEIPEQMAVPMQCNKRVKLLSIEELDAHMQNEKEEREKAFSNIAVDMPDGVVGEGFTKGRGAEIVFASLENPDEDIEQGDSIPGYMNRNVNDIYTSDSLWDSAVYQGRNSKNRIVQALDFDETPDSVEPETEHIEEAEDLFALPPLEVVNDDDFFDDYTTYEETGIYRAAEGIDYTSDELWDKGFYQGRNKDAVPEKVKNFDDEYDEQPVFDSIAETNLDEPVNLWDNITKQGEKVEAIETDKEIVEEFGEELDDEVWQEPEIEDPEYEYDSDNLWDNITQGGKSLRDINEDAMMNSDFEDYDEDRLWDNVVQGDGMMTKDQWIDTVLESDANPYEDYDSDSLWSADIHQGRKKED